MRPVLSFIALPVAAVTLASCGDQEKETASQEMVAGGKILQRSISDEMLPYDTVRSQPPLAKPEKGATSSSDATEGEAEGSGDDATATEGGGAAQSQGEASAGPATPDEG